MRDKAIWYLPQGREGLLGLGSQTELAAYPISATKFPARKHRASVTEVKSHLRTSLAAELRSILMFLNYFRRKIKKMKGNHQAFIISNLFLFIL